MSSHWAIVPAAGIGRRMGSAVPKQYLDLDGRPVIEYALESLLKHPDIQKVLVPLSESDEWWRGTAFAADPRIRRVSGGRERCDSVLNALRMLADEADRDDGVLVHDAARPCLRSFDLDKLINTLQNHPVGGLLAVPLHDTVKRANESGEVLETLPREALWRAYTPQMFRYSTLRSALEDALAAGKLVTDEASAIELAGLSPLLVEGAADNIKITRPEDLPLAAFYLAQIERSSQK